MNSLFNYLINYDLIVISIICSAITLVISLLYTFVLSFRMRTSKSFFITSALTPMVVAVIISVVAIFLDSSTTNVVRIASIAVALGLIRFRSINGKAEEMLVLFAGIGIGVLGGFGLVAYAAILAATVAIMYWVLCDMHIFSHKHTREEKTLRITIPESIDYKNVFDDTFTKYLKEHELLSVKTTNLGSLFRLSYRIIFKSENDEKQFIDEIRTINSNLEISILPFTPDEKVL